VPTPATLTLLTRPGCHLCDAARVTVTEVVGAFPDVAFSETSIADDADLAERYGEEIPVVLINDHVHNIWRIDPARLRTALEEATK
jgi:glutaredoxin